MNVLFDDCGHATTCYACYGELLQRARGPLLCPLCRTVISKLWHVSGHPP